MNLTTESERALVGGVLLGGAIELALVRSEVKPEAIAHKPASVVLAACCRVVDAERELTTVEIAAELEQAGDLALAGGMRGLDELRAEARPADRAELLRHVRDAARLREVGARAVKLGAAASHPLAIANPDRYFAAITALSNDVQVNLGTGTATSAQGCMASMSALLDRGKRVSASPTGIAALDRILNPGFKAKKTHLSGARPGAGKSAFGVQAIGVGATVGHPQLMFSCEMPLQDVFDRIVIQRTQIDSERFEVGTGAGGLTRAEFGLIVAEMEGRDGRPGVAQLPIWVNDDESELGSMLARAQVWLATVARPLIASARRVVDHEGREVGLVPTITIDYIQRCHLDGKWASTEGMFAEMSKRIANFARKEACAMHVLAQVNSLSVKENRPPRASDMKYCDALAADADVVLLLHRQLGADVSDPTETVIDERGRDVESPAMIIVDKHRGGRVGVAWTTWHGPTVRFSDRVQEGPWVPKAMQAGGKQARR